MSCSTPASPYTTAGAAAPTVVYGDAGVLRETAQHLGLATQVVPIEGIDALPKQAPPGTIYVLNRRPPLPSKLPAGRLSADAGRGAYDYLCHAIDDA
ncbi:MAG TPA: hypothetical protein VL003_10190, partial [Pusillimonas sp.]|nr:hypothetical protein [Pusillimonas sp.]